MAFPGLTEGESFVFEWQYRYAGSFHAGLAELVCKADLHNRAKLMRGFPEEVEAMTCYLEVENWWSDVQKKAIKLGLLKPINAVKKDG